MPRRMLIDAAHANEIRVAVVKDEVLEELDFQNSKKKSTKGNIYLAKVTRVEPSLQAAFIEYGGARHGFLPFSEIHPDYYQIPVSDKDSLLEEIRAYSNYDNGGSAKKLVDIDSLHDGESEAGEDETIISINPVSIDVNEDESRDRPEFYKRYKIQEVIKKDQVVLVQIEKEERGTKGAALTTYISIAGRYCVLMPNATKGGGVSRKIADNSDRERLKGLAKEMTLELSGAGAVIIRTAGASKAKIEIKRDCSYLKKLWDNIRAHTIKSNAPTFIHEEGDVIKKAIRDLYDNDIDEILVQGESAFKEAKEFMHMILPKHANKLKNHLGKVSLFSKFHIEQQIAELYSTEVSLKSGGYIVINQTEALVAVDVNSGKATSERNVESTAHRTNLEAAREIARQLRLRDLSGLVVIDFIDMEDNKNKRAVEKALREALLHDKAKIQIGKISHFGLLELSRQRIKQSFVESNTQMCGHCQGRGRIRQIEATVLAILRAIDNEINNESSEIVISASNELISYILNNKRKEIAQIDLKLTGKLLFSIDETAGGDRFFIEKKRSNVDVIARAPLSKIDDEMIDRSPLSQADSQEAEVLSKPKHFPKHNKVPAAARPEQKAHQSDKPQDQDSQVAVQGEPRAAASNLVHKSTKINIRNNHRNPSRPHQNNRNPDSNSAGEPKFAQSNNHRPLNPKLEHKNPDHKHKWKRNPSSPQSHPNSGSNSNVQVPMNFKDDNETKAEAEFEAEMAARRKTNQSLLKEIWKKIKVTDQS